MNKFTRILTLGLFAVALAAAPVVSKVYAAPDNDPPPADSSKTAIAETCFVVLIGRNSALNS